MDVAVVDDPLVRVHSRHAVAGRELPTELADLDRSRVTLALEVLYADRETAAELHDALTRP